MFAVSESKNGAANGIRTRDLLVGNEAFYQLNYNCIWWNQRDLNPRPPACKAGALPTELWTHIWKLVPKAGIEPARYCYHRILSPARLPIPPLRHIYIIRNGVPGTIRTSDPLIKSQLLYQLSYEDIGWCRL